MSTLQSSRQVNTCAKSFKIAQYMAISYSPDKPNLDGPTDALTHTHTLKRHCGNNVNLDHHKLQGLTNMYKAIIVADVLLNYVNWQYFLAI